MYVYFRQSAFYCLSTSEIAHWLSPNQPNQLQWFVGSEDCMKRSNQHRRKLHMSAWTLAASVEYSVFLLDPLFLRLTIRSEIKELESVLHE